MSCKPLLPNALNGIADLVVDTDGATSPVVTWEYAVEVEEAPLIIYIVAIAGFVALALFAASQRNKQEKEYVTYADSADDVEEPEEEHEEESREEPVETMDDVVVDEGSEEPDELAQSSIYDLQDTDEDDD